MDKLLDTIMEKLLRDGFVSEDEAELVRFGLELNIMKLLISAAMLAAAVVFKSAPAALIFMAAYPPLRSCCGGYHAGTRTGCFILSMAVLSTVIAASRFMVNVRVSLITASALTLAGVLFIVLFAPVDTPSKPFDETERRVFRRRSLIAAALSVLLSAVLAFFRLYKLMAAASIAVFFTGIMLVAGVVSNRKGTLK